MKSESFSLSSLQPTTTRSKRVGRGVGSGRGRTSTRGHKGQKARSGTSMKLRRADFARKFPKIGFISNVKKPVEVSLRTLMEQIVKMQDKPKSLNEAQIIKLLNIKHASKGIKIIGNDSVDFPINLEITKVSAGAMKIIESAGGKVTTK